MQTAVREIKLGDRKEIVVAYRDDVEPVLEANKALRAAPQRCDWGRHIASIPNIISMQWLNEAWRSGNTGLRFLSPEWDEYVAVKLKDPDWAFLRTDGPSHQIGYRNGRIGS